MHAIKKALPPRSGAVPIIIIWVLVLLVVSGGTVWVFRRELQDTVKWAFLAIIAAVIVMNLGGVNRWVKSMFDTKKKKDL